MVHEPLDGTALARGVPALEDDAERRPEFRLRPRSAGYLCAEDEPQLEQAPLRHGKATGLLGFGEPKAQIHFGKT
jgi:hypothetical protein